MDRRRIKQRLAAGDCLYGPFVRMAAPAVTEIFGYAGFDFVILDMEHGPMDVYQCETLVRTAEAAGIAPMIRVRENSEPMIVRALDTGASGVQVPQVNSPQAAAAAVAAARFYPLGQRGVCRFTRNAQYSNIPSSEYFARANDESLVILQIEGSEGVRDIDRILETPGIDVLFLGPYDLSQALGMPGKVTDPKVLEVIESITRKARDRNIAVGSFTDQPDTLRIHKDMGIQYLSYGVDTGVLYESARARLEALRNCEPSHSLL